jgi:hypothetical protein
MWQCRLNSIRPVQKTVTGSCTHSNGHLGSIKCEEPVGKLSYHQLLRTVLHGVRTTSWKSVTNPGAKVHRRQSRKLWITQVVYTNKRGNACKVKTLLLKIKLRLNMALLWLPADPCLSPS